MQKPDADPLPDIDDTQDGGVGASYSTPSVAALFPSALGDNAPKYTAAAFILLCFLCFGPRGIAMAVIVLGALRVTLRPISAAGSGSGSTSGKAACDHILLSPFTSLSCLARPSTHAVGSTAFSLFLAGGGGAARGSNIRTLSDLPKSNQGGGG
jgi:hypothetical protein